MSLQDDPRLTAYALGELDAAEGAEIEALLKDDPAAQAEVDAIRSMAALLESELADEAAPAVDETLRADVIEGPGKRRGWMLWASGIAAAAAVGLFVVSANDDSPEEADRYRVHSGVAARSAASAAVVFSDGPAMPESTGEYPIAMAQPKAAPMRHADRVRKEAMDRRRRRTKAEDWRSAAGELDDLLDDGFVVPRSPYNADSNAPTVAYRPTPAPTVRVAAPATRSVELSANIRRVAPQPTAVDGLVDSLNADFYRQRGLRTVLDPSGGEQFSAPAENPFTQPTLEPLSTFSIDVDTASYSMTRSRLSSGRRPDPASVRVEELLNYFDYDYAPPVDGRPFATHIEVAAAPWAPKHRLVRVGLRGKMVDRPRANLVFLLDVSGSMSARNKLPLLKDAMSTLVDNLHPEDRVAIVVYAGASGMVLPSTPAKDKRAILGALDRLKSGGGTNGGAGIQQAYWVAAQNFIRGGVNRVIIGTDGDFNVGTTSRQALVEMVEERAQGGIALTVLGFGMGNSGGGYNDTTLEQLADKGDGNYAFIDTANEARKVLVDQLDGTLVTIAKDVKIQVEFNPAQVAAYRLIGYENRKLAAQDFNDDTKDAGEIGAGHTVTALYEVIPTGVAGGRAVDPLKYQPRSKYPKNLRPASREMLTLKLRYKAPMGGPSKLISGVVIDDGATFDDASADLRFAASVAAFGMLLRGSPHAGSATMDAVLRWASDAIGKDEWQYRRGFLDLVRSAQRLY